MNHRMYDTSTESAYARLKQLLTQADKNRTRIDNHEQIGGVILSNIVRADFVFPDFPQHQGTFFSW